MYFFFLIREYNLLIATIQKTLLCCVQSGKVASFPTLEQSFKRYLKSWIWVKNNYSSLVHTAVLWRCQHFSIKSLDQILIASLSDMLSLNFHFPDWSKIEKGFSDLVFYCYSLGTPIYLFIYLLLESPRKQIISLSSHPLFPLENK